VRRLGYALNFLDRTIFNVLIEAIKKEFALSDTTMGLLTGFGFVLFYSLLGIPIARIADGVLRHGSRPDLCDRADMARPSMRALASAIMPLTAAGFGQGVGPLTVGVLNDTLKNDFGARAVRYSLLSAAVMTTVGASRHAAAPPRRSRPRGCM
jgi:MFS family permease